MDLDADRLGRDAPLKFMLFKLTNHSGRARRLSLTGIFEMVLGESRARRLSLTGIFEMVLGESRAGTLPYVVTEVDHRSGALLARNAYASEFSCRVAFLDCSEERRSHSGDRLECIGRRRSGACPPGSGRTRRSPGGSRARPHCASRSATTASITEPRSGSMESIHRAGAGDGTLRNARMLKLKKPPGNHA